LVPSTGLFRSQDSWEDVKPPTLACLTRANDRFKIPEIPEKLKLGGGAVLSPAQVPFMPQSLRRPLTKIEGMDKSAKEDECGL
jgi:hypothetical protein